LEQHTKLVDETVLLKKQLTEKDTVISNHALELTTVREELAKALADATDNKTKYEKADELRAKWLEAYNQANSNYETCKTDRTTFQKQLTECLNKTDFTIGELVIKIWEKIKRVKI
jgi:urate oxidase